MSGESPHIDAELLQSYLEGELEGHRQTRVEAHVRACPRCASELEAWRLLFEELGELPMLAPSAQFRARVLEKLPGSSPAPAPLGALIRKVLTGINPAARHLSPDRMQDLLEGHLPPRVQARSDAHLAACAQCRAQVASWNGLFRELGSLPALQPSPAFRESVIRGLRERSAPVVAVEPSWLERVRTRARGLAPQTRLGRIVAGSLASAPVLGMLGLFAAVVTHPLLTPLDLAAYMVWRGSDALGAVFDWAIAQAVGSGLVLEVGLVLQMAFSSPGVAISLLATLWLATIGATWILYRNVVAPSLEASRHGRVSP